MARIAGVNIPTNKRVVVGLQYIHGIGPAKAKEIMDTVSIPEARLLSWVASPPWSAGSWAADPHQRTHPQGAGQADRRQEEIARQTEIM